MGGLSDLFAAFFGDDARGGNGSRRRGADVGATIEIELVDASRGTKVSVPFEVAVSCATCGGDGVEPGTETVACPRCEGTGRLQQVTRSVLGQFIRTQSCPHCAGRGVLVEHPCEACEGAGLAVERRAIDVEVPAGIHDGQRIRVSGEGHAGELGGRSGDVYVLVRVKPDPRFVREGNDIYSQVDLTIVQAALGATMSVETLEGQVELELPAGTQPGEVRVLRGKGMPVLQGFGRGDQRVLVNVTVPRRLSDEQRRLLDEFEAASDADTYLHDESFFDKLKSAFR
jgi:molecular chaperone DnaJ